MVLFSVEAKVMCCLPINQVSSVIAVGGLIRVKVETLDRCYFVIRSNVADECQISGLNEEETFSFYKIHQHDPFYKVNCVRCGNSHWTLRKPEPLVDSICSDCFETKIIKGVFTGVLSRGLAQEALFVISFDGFTCHQRSGMTFFHAREFYREIKSHLAYRVECDNCKENFWVFKKPILLQVHTCPVCRAKE